MRKLVFFSLLMFLCCVVSACRSQKVVTSETTCTDSVRIEYIEKTVMVPDTVFVDIPHQASEVATPDSTSRLENDFAISEAWLADGLLHHTLQTKPQTLPVPFLKPLTTVTSSSEHKEQNHAKEIVTEYIERELTWWQQTQIYGCRIMLAILALALVMRYRNKIMYLIRRIL